MSDETGGAQAGDPWSAPSYPGTPNQPGASSYPGTPNQPGASSYPGTPSYPGSSSYPGTPSYPGSWGYPPPAPPRSGLAVASLVMSIIALLGVLVVLAIVFSGAADSGSGQTLTGQVSPAGGTHAVTGDALAAAVSARIEDDDGDVTAMTCPDTGIVQQGVVTVCHGTISGDDWAVVVYFEDTQGSFTLDPV